MIHGEILARIAKTWTHFRPHFLVQQFHDHGTDAFKRRVAEFTAGVLGEQPEQMAITPFLGVHAGHEHAPLFVNRQLFGHQKLSKKRDAREQA